MSIKYPVKMKVQLRPVGQPWVQVSVDNFVQEQQLNTITDFDFDFDANGTVLLTVEHFNKSDIDPMTAVEIVNIEFFGISDPKFAWSGIYTPTYPEPWASKQNPQPAAKLPGQTYLGWNGVYSLTFTAPVFTWIHRVQNLGWIYQ